MATPRDSRDVTLQRLSEVVDEALTTSLVAQLCARGTALEAARRNVPERDTPNYKKLITPDGRSGYLEFQWIAQSLQNVSVELARVDLRSFWTMVSAGRGTRAVYEVHLQDARKPLNDGISGVKHNLERLFDAYPGNKIGVESLEMLKRLQDSVVVIEETISELLLLSPPAVPPVKSRITWKWVLAVFLLFLLTLPVFYWLKARSTTKQSSAVSERLTRDVVSVRTAAQRAPATLPSVIFKDVIPLTSNILLLISALLGLARAFAADARSDTKKMSENLINVAETLRKINSG